MLSYEDEIAYLQDMNDNVMSGNPDIQTAVNIALQQERSLHDARNAKVLQLLQSKVVKITSGCVIQHNLSSHA